MFRVNSKINSDGSPLFGLAACRWHVLDCALRPPRRPYLWVGP
jgi:hypothetical protein